MWKNQTGTEVSGHYKLVDIGLPRHPIVFVNYLDSDEFTLGENQLCI